MFFGVAFLSILNGFGLASADLFSGKLLLAAVVFGVLVGSLALADRVNLLRTNVEVANRDLARSERKYHSLFDNSRDGILITTREGEILDANPTLLDMFGMVRSDLAHKNVQALYADPEQRAKMMRTVNEQGYVQDYPLDLIRIDGTIIRAVVSVSDWLDDNSGTVGLQGVIRDVTEQKRIEEQVDVGKDSNASWRLSKSAIALRASCMIRRHSRSTALGCMPMRRSVR